jgi:hypothetical protein
MGDTMKLYVWTGDKPLKDGKKLIRKGDKIAMSDNRAHALRDKVTLHEEKPAKAEKPKTEPETPNPDTPPAPPAPAQTIIERLAALKNGN